MFEIDDEIEDVELKIGDKVKCINDKTKNNTLIFGGIYTIRRIDRGYGMDGKSTTVLEFDEIGSCWDIARFRKCS